MTDAGRTACRADLTALLREDRLTLYGQPIRTLATGAVDRYELLLRKRDHAGAAAGSAAGLLARAERFGATLELDLWVLERAVRLLSAAGDGPYLQVNMSGRSLGDPRLLPAAVDLIGQAGAGAHRLVVEITETALIDSVAEARRFAAGIRALGCEVALDDFGAGYGSLRYLKQLPVDLIKIDGGFVVDLCHGVADRAIVTAIITMAHTLGMRVVAERVEDQPTLDLLTRLGTDYCQGFHTGRPQPVADLLGVPDEAWRADAGDRVGPVVTCGG